MNLEIPIYPIPADEKAIDLIVGQNARKLRLLAQASQQEVAQLLHHTFQQLQKNEKGINRIGAGRLYQYSRLFGVPINTFYEGLELIEQPTGLLDKQTDKRSRKFQKHVHIALNHPSHSSVILKAIDNANDIIAALIEQVTPHE